jgi:hypothetical protein
VNLEQEAKDYLEKKKTPAKEGLDKEAVRFYLGALCAEYKYKPDGDLVWQVKRLIEIENKLVDP